MLSWDRTIFSAAALSSKLKVVKMLRNEKKVGIVYGGSGSNFLCVMERHWTHRKTNILARVNYCSPTNIWWVWCLVFICWSEYYWSTSHENFVINSSGFWSLSFLWKLLSVSVSTFDVVSPSDFFLCNNFEKIININVMLVLVVYICIRPSHGQGQYVHK